MTLKEFLSYEEEIVWLHDISQYDYVRADTISTHTRMMKPRWLKGFVVVGYSTFHKTLRAHYNTHGFYRRVFWLKPCDRTMTDEFYPTSCPAEAFDPRTITLGVSGEKIARCAGEEQ